MYVEKFIRESNLIEGIMRDPTTYEIEETRKFLDLDVIDVHRLERLVLVYQPGATLRCKPGMDVRVGNHYPLGGGPDVVVKLLDILDEANTRVHPYLVHQRYETLHPFIDGNGRSGRALWAWQMMRRDRGVQLDRGFLHEWYYQSLQFSDQR